MQSKQQGPGLSNKIM